MAVITLSGHVERAIDFCKKDVFVGLGRSTAWANESIPPEPAPTDVLQEAIGYKKVYAKYLVVEDAAGTLEYAGKKWAIVTEQNAYTSGARWVFLSVYIAYDELPFDNVTYRQVAYYTGLQRAEGVDVALDTLLPAQVANPGVIQLLDNREPIYRNINQRELSVQIIEF